MLARHENSCVFLPPLPPFPRSPRSPRPLRQSEVCAIWRRRRCQKKLKRAELERASGRGRRHLGMDSWTGSRDALWVVHLSHSHSFSSGRTLREEIGARHDERSPRTFKSSLAPLQKHVIYSSGGSTPSGRTNRGRRLRSRKMANIPRTWEASDFRPKVSKRTSNRR